MNVNRRTGRSTVYSRDGTVLVSRPHHSPRCGRGVCKALGTVAAGFSLAWSADSCIRRGCGHEARQRERPPMG
jgi:hypothetical protein